MNQKGLGVKCNFLLDVEVKLPADCSVFSRQKAGSYYIYISGKSALTDNS